MASEGHPPRGRGGFTLLELIVALAILALIAGSITTGIRLASTSIERGEAVARDAARLRAAVGIVERAIRSAEPLPVVVGDNTAPYFSGRGKRLRFLTAQPPASIGGDGPRLISFFELSGPGGGLAVATASPFRLEGAAGWEGSEELRILIPGAEEVSFTYSAGPDEEGKWEWLPDWNPTETALMPAAVRVEYSTDAKGMKSRTAFVVPVPAGGRSGS